MIDHLHPLQLLIALLFLLISAVLLFAYCAHKKTEKLHMKTQEKIEAMKTSNNSPEE